MSTSFILGAVCSPWEEGTNVEAEEILIFSSPLSLVPPHLLGTCNSHTNPPWSNSCIVWSFATGSLSKIWRSWSFRVVYCPFRRRCSVLQGVCGVDCDACASVKRLSSTHIWWWALASWSCVLFSTFHVNNIMLQMKLVWNCTSFSMERNSNRFKDVAQALHIIWCACYWVWNETEQSVWERCPHHV
jgi:hypothetical protein